MTNQDERYMRNIHHSLHPVPGDYWHEMFMPICAVLRVTPVYVLLQEKTKEAGPTCWMWDTDAPPRVMSRDEFSKRFRYGSENISGFWADVSPGEHKFLLDEVEQK